MACRALAPRARLWVASPSYHQAQQVRPTPSDLPARLGPSCSQPRVWSGRVGVLTGFPLIQPLPADCSPGDAAQVPLQPSPWPPTRDAVDPAGPA